MDDHYDVVVVGGGAAAAEAAAAAARLGRSALLLTEALDALGAITGSPTIGGRLAPLLSELDASGGLLPRVLDAVAIHRRALDDDPAHVAAAVDLLALCEQTKWTLEQTPDLRIKQLACSALEMAGDPGFTVTTDLGTTFCAGAVVVTESPVCFFAAGAKPPAEPRRPRALPTPFTDSLEALGFRLTRGTQQVAPTVRLAATEELTRVASLSGGTGFSGSGAPALADRPCYSLGGPAEGTVWLVPVSEAGPEHCVASEQGYCSTERLWAAAEITGADVMREGYAVEYDFLLSDQLKPTLESERIDGLFAAGRINGTAGYEEAAVQGFVAGTNAALKLGGEPLDATWSGRFRAEQRRGALG